jgi:hypothetical protein
VPEEAPEDLLAQVLRDPGPLIRDGDECLVPRPSQRNLDRRPDWTDAQSVVHQVEQRLDQERLAAAQAQALVNRAAHLHTALGGQRSDLLDQVLHQSAQVDVVGQQVLLQGSAVEARQEEQPGAGARQALQLLARFFQARAGGLRESAAVAQDQVQLTAHAREGRPQLMGGIRGEGFHLLQRAAETGQHLVEHARELVELVAAAVDRQALAQVRGSDGGRTTRDRGHALQGAPHDEPQGHEERGQAGGPGAQALRQVVRRNGLERREGNGHEQARTVPARHSVQQRLAAHAHELPGPVGMRQRALRVLPERLPGAQVRAAQVVAGQQGHTLRVHDLVEVLVGRVDVVRLDLDEGSQLAALGHRPQHGMHLLALGGERAFQLTQQLLARAMMVEQPQQQHRQHHQRHRRKHELPADREGPHGCRSEST